MKQPLLALGVLLSATTLNVHATLSQSYTGAGNVGLVYSSVSDVTWTQDANLFKTLYDANNNLVNLITAVTPSYDDPSWGNQVIGDGGAIDDFDTETGRLSWWGAKAFVNYLNSISYGGSNQWRLPTSNSITGSDGTRGNELVQLFYSELGGTLGNNIPDTDNFNNEQAYAYWSGSEYVTDPYPYHAWFFDTFIGFYDVIGVKNSQYYAWAFSPGQVAAVPVPGALWIMGSGLLGLVRLKRRGHAG